MELGSDDSENESNSEDEQQDGIKISFDSKNKKSKNDMKGKNDAKGIMGLKFMQRAE